MLSAGNISFCILTEINPEFWSRPAQQKQTLTGLLVRKFTKTEQCRFLYSIILCLATCHKLQHPSLISMEDILVQPISLNPHTILDFSSIILPRNISVKFTIIRDLCRFLQPGLISSSIFCKKLDFPSGAQCNYMVDKF